MTDEALDILRELVAAIDRRWEGETDRKREAAVSPRMDEAIDRARDLFARSAPPPPERLQGEG